MSGLRVRGQHAVAYDTRYPEPGRAEQDPRLWERALGPAIAGALAAARATAADIAAIAIAGQLDGCVAVDARGAPVHPALIWQDRRAVAQATRVPAARVFDVTGQVADPSHLAPKICWLREHGIAAARFHQPVSYLVARLTGAAVIDPALASTTMLLDLATAHVGARAALGVRDLAGRAARGAPDVRHRGHLDRRGCRADRPPHRARSSPSAPATTSRTPSARA